MVEQVKRADLINTDKLNNFSILQFTLGLIAWLWPLWIHQMENWSGEASSLACLQTPMRQFAHPIRMFGLLLLAGMLITYCKRKGYRIILSNFSFIKLLAVSIIFCCIIVESITHDASQLVHVVYFMASFILLSFAALGRYGIVCVALGLLVLIFKYIVTHVFGFAFNAGLLDVILDANSTEIAHFITPANIAFATGALVITTMLSLAAYWSIRRESRMTMATSAIVYALFAYIGVSITIPRINRTADIYCPYSSWWNIQEVSYQARLNRENLIRLVKELPSAADKDSECKTLKGDEGAVVIVHIGESV